MIPSLTKNVKIGLPKSQLFDVNALVPQESMFEIKNSKSPPKLDCSWFRLDLGSILNDLDTKMNPKVLPKHTKSAAGILLLSAHPSGPQPPSLRSSSGLGGIAKRKQLIRRGPQVPFW